MQTIQLGASDLLASRLAYGCWRIARSAVEATDIAVSTRAIHAALDAGYTLFDHADIYCDGRAEAAFGAVVGKTPRLRDQLLIATKCGIRFASTGVPGAPYRYDSSAEHIIRSVEGSLQRLRTDRIDIFQLHRPDWLMHPAEVAAAFAQLHDAGKVRAFGISNFRPSQVTLLAEAIGRPLIVHQVEISLLQITSMDDGTLDQCLARRLTPLAWSPLGGGLLADGAVDILPAQRAYQPRSIVETLDGMALHRGTTRIALALAWLLAHPAGIVPIIGSTDPARIRAVAQAVGEKMTREEWYRLLTAARGAPLS